MSFIDKSIKYALLLPTCVLILSACSTSKVPLKPSTVNTGGTALQDVSTSTPILPTLAPTTIPTAVVSESVGCKTIHMIAICIQDIKSTELGTQVKLRIKVESPMTVGVGNSFISPDYQNEIYPLLIDEYGNSYSMKDVADNYLAQFDTNEQAYFQTLYFQSLPPNVKIFKVSLPMVTVDTPSKPETFQVDLGTNPQPGQTKALDITTIIDGQTFHFIKAEFGGDGIHSLPVTLYMEPLNLPDDIFSMEPAFGDNEKGVFFGGKVGAPFKISADLVIPPGKSSGLTNNTYVSGVLNLEVDRITYWYRGPFEITYQLL